MSTEQRLRSHVLRRELHSPKSALAITLAVVAILALAWVGLESVLAAVGQPALLLSPADIAAGIRGVPDVPVATLGIAGGVLAPVGLALVIAALTPGRRGRHVIVSGDLAAVVDDEVIASALVRTAAGTASISANRAVASIGRRSGTVRITPVSGVEIDRGAVQRAVDEAADRFAISPTIRTRVVVDRKGRVGG